MEVPAASQADGARGDPRPSLATLAARLGIPTGPTPTACAGESKNLDEVMDEFIEEHCQCYEFQDPLYDSPQEDRYVQIFQALQKELCRMTWPPLNGKVSCSRARTLRVLQCLRLLTRDRYLQLEFFETCPAQRCSQERDRDRGNPERDREQPRERERVAMDRDRERGRERVGMLPPPVPATSSRAMPHPPPPTRPGLSASPRVGSRTKRRSPEPVAQRHRVPSSNPFSAAEEIDHSGAVTDRESGLRLPPLDSPASPRRRTEPSVPRTCPPTCALPLVSEDAITPSSSALLRLLTQFVTEHLTQQNADDLRGPPGDMHAADLSAGTGLDARLGVAVTGLCIAEMVGVLNRYASSEARQLRLSQLGTLRPLVCLLSGTSDPLVLRCALETLVNFTALRNTVVFAELAHLFLQTDTVPHGHNPLPCSWLRQIFALLSCNDQIHEGLAAQLLEQLADAPDFRLQMRRLNAIPLVIDVIQAKLDHTNCDSPLDGTLAQTRTKKAIYMIGCCQKLARDHVEFGDPVAVQKLRDLGALETLLGLLRQCQNNLHEKDTLIAVLNALAQMCMDDECATSLRAQYGDGFVTIAALLLDEPWWQSGQGQGGTNSDQTVSLRQEVQRGAARLLRFMFAVERNRKVFKHILSAELLAPFIDIGNYIWPLEAYTTFVGVVNTLPDKDAAAVYANFSRHGDRSLGPKRPTQSRTGEPTPRQGARDLRGRATFDERANTGRIIYGYEVLECVGAGAFGRVHLARRMDVPGSFALKEVPLTSLSDSPVCQPAAQQSLTPGRRPTSRCSTPKELQDGESLESESAVDENVAQEISEEVRLLRQLDHPNVVKYYTSFNTGSGASSTLWIVMEFCNGISLQSFAASSKEKGLTKLPEDQTWYIFVQLCLALRYLHVDKGIAHRDLTPNNVLVQSHSLAVKVADFGLARQKAAPGGNASMMKTMVGTILYSAPEIVQHQPYTNKVDVWALGCLLFKMATLRDPFQGGNPLIVARKIVECDYERLEDLHHSKLLIEVCEACLSVKPETRPDIQEVCKLITAVLVQQLELAQRGGGWQSQQASSPPTMTTSQPQRLMAQSAKELPGVPKLVPDAPSTPPLQPFGCAIRHGDIQQQSTESIVTVPSSTSTQSMQTAQSVQTDDELGWAKAPRRMIRIVEDPVQKALALAHRLAFVGQLSQADKDSSCNHALQVVGQYQRWFHRSSHSSSAVRREISRLMQQVQEPVECLREDEVTYMQLYGFLIKVCKEHGYHDGRSPCSTPTPAVGDDTTP